MSDEAMIQQRQSARSADLVTGADELKARREQVALERVREKDTFAERARLRKEAMLEAEGSAMKKKQEDLDRLNSQQLRYSQVYTTCVWH